jgi:alpha-galactosidase
LESCSSGGNRFDLGMLCFGPQIWVSDCTDPVERLSIQGGLSYLYPPSTFGAHVSEAPHQQTLRQTPLATRFHTACFGCLGYELELKYLSKIERAEIREQIAFYKAHRPTLQFGNFRRLESAKPNIIQWQCTEKNESKAISGYFQTLADANPEHDILYVPDLNETYNYQVTTKRQRLFIKRFGGLIKHVLPVPLNPEGFLLRLVNRFYALWDCTEEYIGDGRLLGSGILLNNQFMGSYYNSETRLLGDFGSNLYLIKQMESEVSYESNK